MKNNTVLFAFLAATVFAGTVLTACASRPEPVRQRPDIHGLISRVEYGGNVAYVFGSMHFGRADWFPLNPAVEAAMARADVFFFEIDMMDFIIPPPGLAEHLAAIQQLPPGVTLKDVLPADIFQNFVAGLETFPNVTYEMVADMTPVAALLAITAEEIIPMLGIEPQYSVDTYVFMFALTNGRAVAGLTDTFYHFSLLLDVDMAIQPYALADFADWQTTLDETLDLQLVEAYEAQDLNMLRRIFSDSFGAMDTPYGRYLVEVISEYRGHIFANGIARLLRETTEPTTFFVTVGIGHLAGGDFGHVFAHLGNMGFDVVPLWN
ncbi:MAG: TraB/GumN family protein [Treponema sp.]|nr:TraB/GumN family protein [Treponema sp.]